MPKPLAKWLFLDMNAFFASVEQQLRPELRGAPVGVVPVEADTSCCIAASYEAKSFGVKTGTKVAEAKRLCPDIHLVRARPVEYVRMHKKIVRAVETVLPVHKVMSIDEMICELCGSERDETRAVALGRKAKQAILSRVGDQLRSSVGIGPNRFLAKVAGGLQKPDGLSVMRKCDLPDALYPLALRDLTGIGRKMEQRLRDNGVDTVAQLCALSGARLRAIWRGIMGEWWWHALRGEELPQTATKRGAIGHSHVLGPQYRNEAGARAVMVKLLHKAATRLRDLEFHTAEMRVHLTRPGLPSWRAKRAFAPCKDTKTLLRILDELWQARPRPLRPLAVSVTLCDLTSSDLVSMPLFPTDGKQERFSAVMDDINLRFGPQSAVPATMLPAADAAPMRISFTKIPDVKLEAEKGETGAT